MVNNILYKFRLDSIIKVKLNEIGLSILRNEHNYMKSMIKSPLILNKFGDFIEPKIDEYGYIEMKLWEFMMSFGDFCFYEGTQEDERNLPFDPEILINNDSLIIFNDNCRVLKK